MKYKSNMAEAYAKVLQSQVKELKEDGHIDVPSMKRLCKVITDNVNDIDTKLDEMSGDESIDTWWTNKMSASSTLIESCRNYIMNPEDDVEESFDLGEAFMDAYVIRFRDKGASENSVVVFKQEHDKDIYVDFLKKKGAKVLSVKKQNLNMKV
jgi:hypothetical protein